MTSVEAKRRPEARGGVGRWPDFFVLGAYKCGTTWAYEALRRRPEIFLGDWKEINFFNRFDGRDLYVERRADWRRRRFPSLPSVLRQRLTALYADDQRRWRELRRSLWGGASR